MTATIRDYGDAGISAEFADDSSLNIEPATLTPDEDGAIRYGYGVITVGEFGRGVVVFCGGVFDSGDDGHIDLMRALRDLIDIIADLAQEEGRDLPDWWTDALDTWVVEHWNDLLELGEELHAAEADR